MNQNKEALFYEQGPEHIICKLCPHNCRIKEGKSGSCRVRKNVNGTLISENYGQICSLSFDPIEKKPLYHFFPGRSILSVGSVGCNLHCKFCQNWEISQSGVSESIRLQAASPEEIVEIALQKENNIGIAYTYNEPIVWYEYMLDIAKLAQKNNLKNAMVTNGFINPEPLELLIPLMDAFSVDLKAFTENFYSKLTSSSLAPVIETLKTIKKSGKLLEITNLVITENNDNESDFREMIRWIAEELGKDTVLHLSRYFPVYKMNQSATSERTLDTFYSIASSVLDFVYLGNIRTGKGQNTQCPQCHSLLIERMGYSTNITGLDTTGKCNSCGISILDKDCLSDD